MVIENELRVPADDRGDRGDSFTHFKGPLFMAWQLNSACNLDCLHCCEEAGHAIPNELNSSEITNFCEQIVTMDIPYVAISGGEPLLHPEFFNICEFFRKHGISLKVETNGTLIDDEIVARFTELGFRSVQVSIDGATALSHEKLRLKGEWQPVIDACRRTIKAGITTEWVFVPTKFNIHEIGDAIDMAYNMGFTGFYTGKTMRIGRAAENWEEICPSDAQYEKFFQELNIKQKKYEGKMKVYFYPYDVIEELKYRVEYPAASLLVIPNGKVKLIGPLPFVCGDLRRHSLVEIWERYKRAWKEPKVIDFAKRATVDTRLLAEANRWVNIWDD